MPNVGLVEGILVLILLVPLVGVIDAALIPNSRWEAADQSKVAWVLVQMALNWVGLIVYLLAIRPRLSTKRGHSSTG